MHKGRIIGAGYALLGLAVIVYSMGITTRMELNEPGPSVFPLLAGVGILICGIGIFLTEYRRQEAKPFLDKEGWRRYGISMVILFAYCLGLQVLGFLPATPLAILALSRLFSQKKFNWIIGIVVSLISTAVIYYIFVSLFHLPLPDGMLF